jgi:hypothetical protein
MKRPWIGSLCLVMGLLPNARSALAQVECDTPPHRHGPGCDSTRNQCEPPVGTARTATLQRATYKINVGSCSACPPGSETSAWLGGCACYITNIQQLKDAGVSKDNRFYIRYATLNAVPPASTQNLVVAFSGQNGTSNGFVSGGGSSNLTGHPDGFDQNCNDEGCGALTFDERSLALRLLRPEMLGASHTRVVVFPDQRYDWGNSENPQISNGLTAYLRSLVTAAPMLRMIVIAGHSRGGCLAMTVATKLSLDPSLSGVRILVLPVDAVCNPDEPYEEHAVQSGLQSQTPNPLVNDPTWWYAWFSPYGSNSGLQQNSCMANVVGGVWWSPLFVHALITDSDPVPSLNRFTNWWASLDHKVIGTSYVRDELVQDVGSLYYFVKNNLLECNPANCAGCCAADGSCVLDMSASACGAGGAACAVCGSGQTCQNGACTSPPPPCGPGNCNGCCNASGACVTNTSGAACGAGGAACVVCPGIPNGIGICSAGSCAIQCNYSYHDCGDGKCVKTACK